MCRYVCNYGPPNSHCHVVHRLYCCMAPPNLHIVIPSIHAHAVLLHGPAQFTCSHPCGPHMLKPNSLHFPSTHAETIIAWSNPFHMQFSHSSGPHMPRVCHYQSNPMHIPVITQSNAQLLMLIAPPTSHAVILSTHAQTLSLHGPTHFMCSHRISMYALSCVSICM